MPLRSPSTSALPPSRATRLSAVGCVSVRRSRPARRRRRSAGRPAWVREPAHVVSASDIARDRSAWPTSRAAGTLPVRVSSVPERTSVRSRSARRSPPGCTRSTAPCSIDRGQPVRDRSAARAGSRLPVSIFRVDAGRGPRAVRLAASSTPTSMAFGPDGRLYVSSRFEGTRVPRGSRRGDATPFATDLGVACGLAFGRGRHAVRRRSLGHDLPRRSRRAAPTSSRRCPPSVAAFHLAFGPDGWLYVTAPTLASCDRVYRVIARKAASRCCTPASAARRGWPSTPPASLYVVEALAGASGVYRARRRQRARARRSGEGLVGLAFDPNGAPGRRRRTTRCTAFARLRRRVRDGSTDGLPRPMTPSFLFRRKPIADLRHRRRLAARAASACSAPATSIMLAIGAVIGAGIFGAIGTAAAGQVGAGRRRHPLRRRARRWSSRSSCSAARARSRRSATRSWPR